MPHSISDKPVPIEHDRLGFKAMAESLVPRIADLLLRGESTVIGIEGRWGSGKTTLLNAVCGHADIKDNTAIKTIHIAPWLGGDTESPGVVLLNEMRRHFEGLEGDAAQNLKADYWRNTFLGYAAKTAKHGGGIAGAIVGAMTTGTAGTGLRVGQKVGDGLAAGFGASQNDKSSADMKKDVADVIRESGLRFLVVLDDLDRLEPSELAEVIRLVKSVGDLPNTVYLLCYDRAVVAKALETALRVNDGFEYLEKIIQLTVAIPEPEIFVLRRMLLDDLKDLYQKATGSELNKDDAEQLSSVIGKAGGALHTPRAVKKVLNAVAFIFPQIRNNVYFPDFCWVQIIRIVEPKLHNLVERYLSLYSRVATGNANLTGTEKKHFGEEFAPFLKEFDDFNSAVTLMLDLLPGLSDSNGSTDPAQQVFQQVHSLEQHAAYRKRRVASVSHWRYYFAFAPAQDIWSEDEFSAISDAAAKGKDDVVKQFREFKLREREYGQDSFESFVTTYIARLEIGDDGIIRNSFLALADLMDEWTSPRPVFDPGLEGAVLFAVAEKLVDLNKKAPGSGAALATDMMREGAAIGWLYGRLFGHFANAHGLNGEKQLDIDEVALDKKATLEAKDIMTARIRQADQDGAL